MQIKITAAETKQIMQQKQSENQAKLFECLTTIQTNKGNAVLQITGTLTSHRNRTRPNEIEITTQKYHMRYKLTPSPTLTRIPIYPEKESISPKEYFYALHVEQLKTDEIFLNYLKNLTQTLMEAIP